MEFFQKMEFYKSELTVSNDSNPRGKVYLGVLMSIIVLLVISSMIVAAIVIINPDIVNLSSRNLAPRQAITLEEALFNELSASIPALQWINNNDDQTDDELLFEEAKNLNIIRVKERLHQQQLLLNQTLHNSNPTKLNVFEPRVTNLISNTSLISSVESQGFKLSPSRRYLLIWTSKRKQFRHTFTAKYFLYDIKNDLISLLSTNKVTGGPTEHKQQNSYEHLDSETQYLNDQEEDDKYTRFQMVDWYSSADTRAAPLDGKQNSKRSDSLVLIQNNDIYILDDVAGGDLTQNNSRNWPIRITSTGKKDEIFNGIPDWLYEEEILSAAPAFHVSPNGSYLAYMSFNDSRVDSISFSLYNNGDQSFSRLKHVKYPRAGRVNPTVSVYLVDLVGAQKDVENIRLQLPYDLDQKQHYITRIKWLTNQKLSITWLNRSQNESYIIICSPDQNPNWSCKKNLHLSSSTGWLDMVEDLYPLDENHYLCLVPRFEGADVGSFKHIARVSLNKIDSYTFLTKGRKEVVHIDGISKENDLVYYTSTVVNEPGQRQLYSVNINSNGINDDTEYCITCGHYPEECLYNFAKISPSAKHYIFECNGPGIPKTELRKMPTTREKLETLLSAKSLKSDASTAHHDLPSGSSADQVLPKKSFGLDDSNSLLWTFEDNQVLRDKLIYAKAMPLTVRLKVPIPDTNYSADVLMLLPPQLGGNPTANANLFSGRSLTPATTTSLNDASLPSGKYQHDVRSTRDLSQIMNEQLQKSQKHQHRPHSYFTADSIDDYTRQLSFDQKYPMVVDVYGGPGSQKVDYQFNVDFGHYLASSRRTIYVMIDGRGSAYQGTKRLHELHHRLGTVEIQDQIEVVAYLTRNYSFIDSTKVAIWGWSYGGYAAAMALIQSNARAIQDLRFRIKSLQNQNNDKNKTNPNSDSYPIQMNIPKSSPLPPIKGVFECAISVAPVTDWMYYDTAYTERFMSSPYLNEQYDKTKPGDHNHHEVPNIGVSQRTVVQHNDVDKLDANAIGSRWMSLNQTIDPLHHLRVPLSSSLLSKLMHASNEIRSPDINERYRVSSLLEHVANIDKKRFLLIHGTADDNVHFLQSIMLMKRLIQKNILYETRLYPDQDHSIADKASKLHLGSTLTNFFAECFDMSY